MKSIGKSVMKGAFQLNALISAVVVALILGLMISTIADNTIGINSSASNVTGSTYTLVSFVPLVLVLAVVICFFRVMK